MTKTRPTPLDTLLSRLRDAHPALRLTCDVPTTSTGSTWVDIRVGADWGEYRPELGFGFSDPRNNDGMSYGTPWSRFARTVEEASAQLDQLLQDLGTPSPSHSRA